MDIQLRLIAAVMIAESNLSKGIRLQLLNFIEGQATDAQVKVLLMDGKIMNLDEQAEEIVNDRFPMSEAGGKVAQTRKTYFSAVNSPAGALAVGAAAGGPVGAASAIGGSAIWLLYRAIRGKYDKCTKQCGTLELNTARRQHCMAKCKIGKVEQELKAAMKAKNAKEIAKKKAALAKAKNTFQRMEKSFAGKNKPGE